MKRYLLLCRQLSILLYIIDNLLSVKILAYHYFSFLQKIILRNHKIFRVLNIEFIYDKIYLLKHRRIILKIQQKDINIKQHHKTHTTLILRNSKPLPVYHIIFAENDLWPQPRLKLLFIAQLSPAKSYEAWKGFAALPFNAPIYRKLVRYYSEEKIRYVNIIMEHILGPIYHARNIIKHTGPNS